MGFVESASEGIGEFFLDILILIGCAMGGGQAAAAPILTDLQSDAYDRDPSRLLTPEQAAEGLVKGALDGQDATDEARKGGLNHDRFAALVGMTGNPPGAETLIELWRRGHIDQADVERGLRQGYTRNDWIGAITGLRYRTLGVSEAVQAAVQNHVGYDEARGMAEAEGVHPDGFSILYANAGNPPGAIELLNLWVRGYITEADVDQGLRESRLKDKWIPALKQLAVRKIPLRTITTLLNNGAISDDQARQHLRELGYSAQDADSLIAGHKAQKAAPHHELSATQVRDLYASHMIGYDEAVSDLVRAGYTDADARAVLDVAQRQANRRLQAEGIGRVRAAYLARHIDRHTAEIDLDRLQVAGTQRDELLVLWDVEQSANVKTLTPAQIVAAGRKGIIERDEVVRRLMGEGYAFGDAILLAMLGGAIPIQGDT